MDGTFDPGLAAEPAKPSTRPIWQPLRSQQRLEQRAGTSGTPAILRVPHTTTEELIEPAHFSGIKIASGHLVDEVKGDTAVKTSATTARERIVATPPGPDQARSAQPTAPQAGRRVSVRGGTPGRI